ncbi:Cytochrome c oxidase subunit 5A [Rhizophlyctis rosea]|nr:Cytochrome c oxidase subunit 5A [Rhizophlyctis rosea]
MNMGLTRLATRTMRPATLLQSSIRLNSSSAAPTLHQLETRWAKLPECEQGAIADQLAEAQKGDWKNLSLEQKRAAYWIAYGAYGARSPKDPGMWKKVTLWTSAGVGLAVTLWWFWKEYYVPEIKTMTPEWKEAEYRRDVELKRNPYSGAYAQYMRELEKQGKSA